MSDNIGTKSKQKVAVALSGGLDSSVTCLLLKQQGYDVVAITVKMFDGESAENIVLNAEDYIDTEFKIYK